MQLMRAARFLGPHVQVTLKQRGVDDLQQLLAALDGRCSLHERGGGGRVRVVQLLHQVAALLQHRTEENSRRWWVRVHEFYPIVG